MKNKYQILIVILVSLLLGCNSRKNASAHNHISDDHVHTDKSIIKEQNNYFAEYTLKDEKFGTNTIVTISKGIRTMETNALPNHKTGNFPNQGNPNTISAQSRTYTFPVNPRYVGKAQWMREPGVALNGIKFEPGTAEVVVCETGENYRVEALQDVIDLGLDFNNAHVQPTGAYHYHGTPTSVINNFDTGKDLVHIGFAHDGFPIYFSKSGNFKPSFKLLDGTREGEDCSYENPMQKMDISIGGHHDGTYGSDYEYVEGFGDLDECNGITIEGKYMYLVTNEFPYVSRCLMGEVTKQERRGPPPSEQGRRGQRGQGGPPNIDELFNTMDLNSDEKLSKEEVKGPLLQKFSEIDINNDGFLTKLELEKAPKPNRQRSRGGRPQNHPNRN